MKDEEIVHIALENLRKNVGITGKWKTIGHKDYDGRLEMLIDNKLFKLNTKVRQELRAHQLTQLAVQAEQISPLIVIANRIFPKIKEELREKQIAYLEANGNIYIKQNGLLLWVDAQKSIPTEKDNRNRAFTKTGLKVVFQFMLDDNYINYPYREIAAKTEVGLGNINYVMNGLKEMGFLIKLNKDHYKLVNKKELLEKWMAAYDERLKPTLKVGTFRFLKEEEFKNWKKLPLKNAQTCWGGEPAADILTNYLRPAELTLYTNETRSELIKNYRLVPDEKGNVKVYKNFWKYWIENDNIAPPLLVYADLINTNDRRCIETAQKIYNEFLQGKL